MSVWWTILAMGIGMYALRLTGLTGFGGLIGPDAALPPAWERALGFVPVALLTALVVSSLASGDVTGDERALRVVAVVVAGVVVWRTRRMWLCIASGMAVFWAARWCWTAAGG